MINKFKNLMKQPYQKLFNVKINDFVFDAHHLK